jgi:hypothetical protein
MESSALRPVRRIHHPPITLTKANEYSLLMMGIVLYPPLYRPYRTAPLAPPVLPHP